MATQDNLNRILDSESSRFAPVSPLLLKPWQKGTFAVYLRQGGRHVLYTNKGAAFTSEQRAKLGDMDVNAVYIPRDQFKEYEAYLRDKLDDILVDDAIPVDVRSRAWMQCSVSLVRSVFKEKLPKQLFRRRFSQMSELVRQSIDFFQSPEAMQNVAKLVAKGFKNYNHAMGTMVLNCFMLQAMGYRESEFLVKTSLGAMLHDVGKTSLPPDLVHKRPTNMSAEEREQFRAHPSIGVGACINLPLALETYNSILFHHEHFSGTGYPSKLEGENIPIYVRTLAVCNEYDGLTRVAAWRPALTPYEALQRMETRKERYDPDAFKTLILILSNAAVLDDAEAEKLG